MLNQDLICRQSWLRHVSQTLTPWGTSAPSTTGPNDCVCVCVCETPAVLCLPLGFWFFLFFPLDLQYLVVLFVVCVLFVVFFSCCFFCICCGAATAPPRPLPPPPPPPPQEGEGVEEQVVCLPAGHCDLELYTPQPLYRHRPIEAPVSPFPPQPRE